MSSISRREGLLAGLFGSGYIGLRALATGLPAWYLMNPRRATAQDLQCAIGAREYLQYLIVSANSNGDPLNCNVPGTYEGSAATAIHPMQAEMAPTPVTLGAATYTAALPWASTEVGGALTPATLSRIAFFHHRTGTTVHGDQPKVMKLLGDTSGGEMFVSAYAKHLAACFGTVQAAPIAVGARGNSSELISFGGRMLPSISPTQLKQLLTGTTGRATSTNPLVGLRPLRDNALNQLNAMAKSSGSDIQKQFLDKLATSQTQIRAITDALQTTLTSINSDDVTGQALAAVALIVANVTPVVTMRIAFGGDNHTDANLQAEVDQHVTGVAGIQTVMTALANAGLADKVTFATMNVFGRNLNGISKVTSRAGRDHYGNHSVMVMVGKNVKPGVIGGAVPGSGSNTALVASDIDSATGASMMGGGDIPANRTHVSAARTLGAALGLPDSVANGDYIAAAGGKVVGAALTSLPTG